jgi:hypothetical protein
MGGDERQNRINFRKAATKLSEETFLPAIAKIKIER